MEFKNTWFLHVFRRAFESKFSIRISILGIVLILLIGISVLIIGINFFAINSVLVASAKNSLFQSSGRVAEQIKNYLQPLNSNIMTANRIFMERVVKPGEPEFTRFLYSLIADNENLVASFWADTKGNFYWLNRKKNGFFEEVILRDGKNVKTVRKELNAKGKEVGVENLLFPDIDPHQRPWYKKAEALQKLTWVVHRLVKAEEQVEQFGVTSAFPIYDAAGNLTGVFGIDMLLGAIAQYVENIKLTENSFIFVVDDAGSIISARLDKKYLLQLDEVPEISDVKAAWIKKSFDIYRQKHESSFVYSSNGERYVAAYEKIGGVRSDNPWFVAIVTPINDIIAPLLKNIFIGVIFVFLALVFGIFMASIFSSSLSRPIKKLANDANSICQLELGKVVYLFSRIKEIAEMADSFIKMKNALYSFQRYMPITLVRKLIISNKIATVGGEAKELTLLFTDIRNFTQLSEGFEPESLMQYLSEYFQSITKIVIETSGTVDKYIGDGVMAFWGAPLDDADHAYHACQAVLQIKKALQQLNLKWSAEGKPTVVTRFGMSTGHVVVGNVGSDDKLSYTSLGDTVNLASRLEELNKAYMTAVIIGEATYNKVKDKFKFRLIDKVAVRGKTQGVYIYELLDELGLQLDEKLMQFNQEFSRAFSYYEQGDWQRALDMFAMLYKQHPEDHIIEMFVDRCSNFIASPPLSWNGIWVMGEK